MKQLYVMSLAVLVSTGSLYGMRRKADEADENLRGIPIKKAKLEEKNNEHAGEKAVSNPISPRSWEMKIEVAGSPGAVELTETDMQEIKDALEELDLQQGQDEENMSPEEQIEFDKNGVFFAIGQDKDW